MFRKMRRFKQQLSDEECIAILQREKRGVLSVLGDDGYPYGVPVDHWYNPADGKLYFHGAKTGHKIDAIKACDKVSYCVIDQGEPAGDSWDLNFKSVVVFGRIAPVEDREAAFNACRGLCSKFTDDPSYAESEIQKTGRGVLVLALTPEHITGKRVNES